MQLNLHNLQRAVAIVKRIQRDQATLKRLLGDNSVEHVRKPLSAASKAKIAASQRARWAALKKAEKALKK